jgi:hypothetical protein
MYKPAASATAFELTLGALLVASEGYFKKNTL